MTLSTSTRQRRGLLSIGRSLHVMTSALRDCQDYVSLRILIVIVDNDVLSVYTVEPEFYS
jgi:hypothetical protein